MSNKQSESLQSMIYNDDDYWFQESYFFTELWLLNVLMIKLISSWKHHLYSLKEQ